MIVFALGAIGWAARQIGAATQTLDDLGTVEYTPPPHTPTSASSPAPPTREPMPEGWRIERDPFTGNNYLDPPLEVETAVQEAFEAVLSLEVIEDRSNEEALAYDRGAALTQVEELATADVVERYRHLTHIELGSLGPRNPVQCRDYDVCEIVRAKLGVVAYVAYDPEMCAGLDTGIPAGHKGANGSFLLAGDGSHCVTRFVEDDNPRAIYFATVELDGDRWVVTDLQWESIGN
ncbi:MAG: hypothetical protein GY842_26930 [bacterium]|nr:hypothetical protein [bacterium]